MTRALCGDCLKPLVKDAATSGISCPSCRKVMCPECGGMMHYDDSRGFVCPTCDSEPPEVPCDHPCDAVREAFGAVCDCDGRVWLPGEDEPQDGPRCGVCAAAKRQDDEGEWVCPRCGTDFGDGEYQGEDGGGATEDVAGYTARLLAEGRDA